MGGGAVGRGVAGRGLTVARNKSLGKIPADTDQQWPAFARHPDQCDTPLQWGLRYIAGGDVMQPDGTVLTLDEIADQFGLPRLDFLEEVPPPLED